jgi:hypothetical protein
MKWNWHIQCLRRTMKEARNDLPMEMKRATEDDMHAAAAGTLLLYSLQRVTYSLSEFRDLTAKLLCLMTAASKLPSFDSYLIIQLPTKEKHSHAASKQ